MRMMRYTGRRRRLWYLGSQFSSSASNFLLVMVSARSLSTEDFGAFSVALAVYLIVIGAIRSLLLVPALAPGELGPLPAAHLSRAGLSMGAVAALLVGLGSVFSPSAELRNDLLAIAFVIPPTSWHEAVRHNYFARDEPRGAAVADLRWLAAFAALVAVGLGSGFEASGPTALLAWGASSLAGLIGQPLRGPRQHADRTRSAALVRSPGIAFFAEFLLRSGTLQLSVAYLGTAHQLASAGALRAALTAIAPAGLVTAGFTPMLIGAAASATDLELPRLVRRWTTALALLVAGYSVAVGLLPRSFWEYGFGSSGSAGRVAFARNA